MKISRLPTVILALLAALGLTGCWSRGEINNTAFIIAIGVDHGSEEEPVRLTAQVAIPRALATEKAGSREKPVWIDSIDGRSIDDALAKLLGRLSRRISLSHLQTVIFGEELARHGVGPYIDFFDRSRESRRSVIVLVSKGEAKAAVEAAAALESFSGIALRKATVLRIRANNFHADDMGKLLFDLHTGRSDPSVGAVTIETNTEGRKEISLRGMGVFRQDRLVGFLEDEEAKGLILLLGRPRQMPVAIGSKGAAPLTVVISRVDTRLHPGDDPEPARMRIEIRCEGEIVETTKPLESMRPEDLAATERQIEENLKQSVERTVARAQKLRSDFLGYGQHFFRFHPRAWSRVAERWPEVFPQVKTDVEVRFRLSGTGIIEDTALPVLPRSSGNEESEER